jgi:hypothetical protein
MHSLTAFFENRGHAEAARAKLRQAGVPDANLSVSPEVSGQDAEAETGFWAKLKDVFGAEPDHPRYREGLRRGVVMIVVHVEDERVGRACGILDEHGAIDMDEREQQWRREGWTGAGPTAGVQDRSRPSSSRVRVHAWAGREKGRLTPYLRGETPVAPELREGSMADHPENGQERLSPYLRGEYSVATDLREGSMADSPADELTAGLSAKLVADMEVLGADGQHVGVIDHIEGASIELKKDDPAAHGRHHFIPLDWVASVDRAARLKLSAPDAWSRWTAA